MDCFGAWLLVAHWSVLIVFRFKPEIASGFQIRSLAKRHGHRRGSESTKGFALVAVIWTLGLISLLSVAAMVGTRYRIRIDSGLSSVTEAAAAAESAINLGIVSASNVLPDQNPDIPLRCRLPGGEFVTVVIEDEAGKVDLNTATPAVLIRLFTALTHDPATGGRIAEQILAFRSASGDRPDSAGTKARSTGNKPDSSATAGFVTILQLDQIDAISPKLFQAAIGFLTVRSGRPEPVGGAASPALRKLLNLDPKTQSVTQDLAAGRNITIRADVRSPNGARFIREALISLDAENGRPYVIREWRRGFVTSGMVAVETRNDAAMPAKDCLGVGQETNS
jgi:general secretion pathway protein K